MPKKKEKKVTTGNMIAQEKEKKCNLNWGYLCKVHLSALFPPHFPPKLGG